jgi:serine acetyltransferase
MPYNADKMQCFYQDTSALTHFRAFLLVLAYLHIIHQHRVVSSHLRYKLGLRQRKVEHSERVRRQCDLHLIRGVAQLDCHRHNLHY